MNRVRRSTKPGGELLQEIRCDIDGDWVECYDYIMQGDPDDPIVIYCTRHESEEILQAGPNRGVSRLVRDLLRDRGIL